MAKNSNLHNAKTAKNDEFYTQLTDIEKELKHYKKHFEGKVVYCNCDDVRWSNFFKYFSMNFEHLGLKKLICTAYNENGQGIVYEYNGDLNGNRIVDDEEIEVKYLEGNGDFRSAECIEILKQADIVVTNPPFSLFREYVAQLMEYGKQFLIIGNTNAITYKEVFPLIKDNQLWLGVSSFNCGMYFQVPENYEYANTYKFDRERNGHKVIRVSSICWFTNLEHTKRYEDIILYKKYTTEEYPKYDNYDAINVNKVSEIPCDYDGVMGVPITFLDKYNPNQFEIVEFRKGEDGKDLVYTSRERESSTLFQNTHPSMQIAGLMNNPQDTKVNGKSTYARILIRKIK